MLLLCVASFELVSVDLILYFWWPEAQVFVGHEGSTLDPPWRYRPLTVVLGKFWTSDKTVSACVGNSSRFRHFWQREEGATLVMRDFPVKSQWRHILRHLHQRCSEYKRIQKAYEKLGLFQRLATFFLGGVFSTRHIWPMPPYQSRCFPAQLVSPWNWPGWCRSERGIQGAFKVNGGVVHTIHWDSLGELQKQNTETRKIGWYWHYLALVLFSVALSSLVFKPWPSMWHRVWITSATSLPQELFQEP